MLGVRSGGGGVSHSGRMSADYNLAQAFRQMQLKSVEGLRFDFMEKVILRWKYPIYRGIIFFRKNYKRCGNVGIYPYFDFLLQMKGEYYDKN